VAESARPDLDEIFDEVLPNYATRRILH